MLCPVQRVDRNHAAGPAAGSEKASTGKRKFSVRHAAPALLKRVAQTLLCCRFKEESVKTPPNGKETYDGRAASHSRSDYSEQAGADEHGSRSEAGIGSDIASSGDACSAPIPYTDNFKAHLLSIYKDKLTGLTPEEADNYLQTVIYPQIAHNSAEKENTVMENTAMESAISKFLDDSARERSGSEKKPPIPPTESGKNWSTGFSRG